MKTSEDETMTIKLTPAGADLMEMNLFERIHDAVRTTGPLTRASLKAKIDEAISGAYGDTYRDCVTVTHDKEQRLVTINMPAFVITATEDET
jgi:hypothetical protein